MRKRMICVLISILLMLTACQGSSNADLSTDNTETSEIVKTEEEEEITIYVYDPLIAYPDTCSGWMGKIYLDELGINIKTFNEYSPDYPDDINADIIIYVNTAGLKLAIEEEHILEEGKLLEWSDELLEEHGGNIVKYLQESMDMVADICGGKVYGIKTQLGIDAGKVFTISSTSEHPEKAMELINWMADPDNQITLQYGPKGLCWDVDEEGYYYLTEWGLNAFYNRDDVQVPEEYGGGYFGSGYSNVIGMVWHEDAVNPNSKHGESFNHETWKLMQ